MDTNSHTVDFPMAQYSSPKNAKAVVLLSGGLDSTTTLAIASGQGYVPCSLTVRYDTKGARHQPMTSLGPIGNLAAGDDLNEQPKAVTLITS